MLKRSKTKKEIKKISKKYQGIFTELAELNTSYQVMKGFCPDYKESEKDLELMLKIKQREELIISTDNKAYN